VSQPTVNDMMVAYAQDGVDYAKQRFGITLDYSEPSVQLVEEVLGKMHQTIPKSGIAKLFKKTPPKETVDQLSKMLGGYVGEVMRRHWGGEWKLESAAFPGQQVVTLHVANSGDVWPHFKAGKRLLNGAEDNIWHYFQVSKQKYVKQQV
jgi:hypothetical protein